MVAKAASERPIRARACLGVGSCTLTVLRLSAEGYVVEQVSANRAMTHRIVRDFSRSLPRRTGAVGKAIPPALFELGPLSGWKRALYSGRPREILPRPFVLGRAPL